MVLALSSMLSPVYVSVGVWGYFAAWTPVPPMGHDGVHFVLPPHPDHLLFHLSPWQEEIPDRRRKAEVGLTPTLLLLPRDWPPSQRLCCSLQQGPQSKSWWSPSGNQLPWESRRRVCLREKGLPQGGTFPGRVWSWDEGPFCDAQREMPDSGRVSAAEPEGLPLPPGSWHGRLPLAAFGNCAWWVGRTCHHPASLSAGTRTGTWGCACRTRPAPAPAPSTGQSSGAPTA